MVAHPVAHWHHTGDPGFEPGSGLHYFFHVAFLVTFFVYVYI